jgi:hypothetical protein
MDPSWLRNRYLVNRQQRFRLLLCLGVGALLGTAAYAGHQPDVGFASDWDEIHAAARALLHGDDPYRAMEAAYLNHRFLYPLIYPATAVIVGLPFALVPLPVALGIWSGLGSAGLAWVLTRRGWWGLLGLLSAPFFYAFMLVQWSPLLTAAVAFPAMGFLWVAKPTIGIPLFVAWPSKGAAIGGAALAALSFLILPHWPAAMHEATKTVPFVKPIAARLGGALLLLGLLRWRLPEGRMLAGMSVVPQTLWIYELVPLLLIPRTWRQMTAFVAFGWVTFALAAMHRPSAAPVNFGDLVEHYWPFWLGGVYLPALVMVLCRRNATVIEQSNTPGDPVSC